MSEAGAETTVVAGRMTKGHVQNLVLYAPDIVSGLAEADPELNADLYAALGGSGSLRPVRAGRSGHRGKRHRL
jgi:hypothetical protein